MDHVLIAAGDAYVRKARRELRRATGVARRQENRGGVIRALAQPGNDSGADRADADDAVSHLSGYPLKVFASFSTTCVNTFSTPPSSCKRAASSRHARISGTTTLSR